MVNYETVLIVNPNLTEEELDALSQKVKKAVEDLGALNVRVENWGKRRLTYEIKKAKKGYYLIFGCQFGAGNFVAKIDNLLRYNENILKYMTVKTKGLVTTGGDEIKKEHDAFTLPHGNVSDDEDNETFDEEAE